MLSRSHTERASAVSPETKELMLSRTIVIASSAILGMSMRGFYLGLRDEIDCVLRDIHRMVRYSLQVVVHFEGHNDSPQIFCLGLVFGDHGDALLVDPYFELVGPRLIRIRYFLKKRFVLSK